MTKFIPLFLITLIHFHAHAQDWKTPIIDGYGRIVDYEKAVIKPNPANEYKLLFHITTNKEREGVNVALWKIARTINLLENGGVPKKNIHVAAVVSGPATPLVLNKEVHLSRMKKPNPNLDLIDKLVEYGVALHLCGQAAAERDVDPTTDLNPKIELTLSALIDIPTYQMQGYSIIF
ncbi:DsrE family protein [Xanthomarina sp. F1114]|uniref:DsrE family protein n=1 Tax=Xanthomarina sp. F1114 TaxID=2996019 RepID=UPI00225DFBA2|nr:DsrE family protein [Xanthomarina sp. F1114]MCX7548264.1 DsrE family protein [Xanthomarina sp. F1114]